MDEDIFSDVPKSEKKLRQEPYLDRDKKLLAIIISEVDKDKTLFTSKRDAGTRQANFE